MIDVYYVCAVFLRFRCMCFGNRKERMNLAGWFYLVYTRLVWLLFQNSRIKFDRSLKMSNKGNLQNQLQNLCARNLDEFNEVFDCVIRDYSRTHYCSATVANHRLITVISFVAKSCIYPWRGFENRLHLILHVESRTRILESLEWNQTVYVFTFPHQWLDSW